ncbi:MAG TPA: ATP-binding cassette domain-containing protein [Mycobacteriales bacterium]|nr:ATP-binding cassette domain-containing protein [Mycobacteriales bacterium]
MSAVVVTDLVREFVVRRSTGRLRRDKQVIRAVDGISFEIALGDAVGYIGANGAGKSTTIKMLTGILVPTAGTVQTLGLDPVSRRRELARGIGAVFGQRSQLWWDLPLGESFRILAALHELREWQPRVAQLVERLELGDFLRTPVRQLSLGERMRGEVAAALVHSPALLVLDEPTIGLDVLSKEKLRVFLREERTNHGTTLLLTTHDMTDIERLCDRVLVVDKGRLAYDGTLTGLAATMGAERVLVVDLVEPRAALSDIPGTRLLSVEGGGLRQRLAFTTSAAAVLAAVADRCEIRDLTLEEPDIDDVVRKLYARGGR